MTFHPIAIVVLIPTAVEYHKAGLGSMLWWDGEDYRMFKQSAINSPNDHLIFDELEVYDC